jgi:hypothetical protein
MNEIFDGPSLALSPPCCVAPCLTAKWRRLNHQQPHSWGTGRQLAIADFAGQAGLQRFELRSAHWVPGTYWVSVIVDGHREVRLVEKF